MAPSSPYVCGVCRRHYTRAEHLARHQRTHTREKPFACGICGKAFSRRDLLNRHTSIHGADEQPFRGSRNVNRGRAKVACSKCAELKVRCSEGRPCKRCKENDLQCDTQGNEDLPGNTSTAAQRIVSGDFTPELTVGMLPQTTYTLLETQMNDRETVNDTVESAQQFSYGEYSSETFDPWQRSGAATFESNNQENYPFLGIEDGFDDVLMGNFLHDVMGPGDSNTLPSADYNTSFPNLLHVGFEGFANHSLPYTTDSSTAFAQSSDRQNGAALSANPNSAYDMPSARQAIDAGQRAFKESMWLWEPSMEDSTASEQMNLALTGNSSATDTRLRSTDPKFRISAKNRDRLLSAILNTCERPIQRQIVSCFPSADFLSSLFADFKMRHEAQISPWIHFPTLNLDNECEEFLLAVVCAGAADSKQSDVRRLGFAMQEAARVAILKKFEEDNKYFRDLRSIQAFLIILTVGLNSASRRKIEIAESLTLNVVTMLRRGAWFKMGKDGVLLPVDGSEPRDLQITWRKWVEQESFKRLVYHVLFQDVQTSAALCRQLVISYPEINLRMPYPKQMWAAETEDKWVQAVQSAVVETEAMILSPSSCAQDLSLLDLYQSQIDLQMSLRIVVSILWMQVWQLNQAKEFSLGDVHAHLLPTTYARQQIVANGQELSTRFSEGPDPMHPCVKIMLELCLMHANVSLGDIQRLAGSEGEEQAREAASRLRIWISTAEGRQALFHAGQIARIALQCPPQYLRGFHAVIIYHASLIMWTHGLLATSHAAPRELRLETSQQAANQLPAVRIDEDDTPELRRYILLGNAIPCMQKYLDRSDNAATRTARTPMIPLTNPSDVMVNMAAILKSRDQHDIYCIPIVSYLTRLMHSLAKASAAMKLGR